MTKNSRIFRDLAIGAIALLLSVPAPPAGARAGELVVAAAADLTFAFKDVGARFERETGNSIKLSYGSSGNFLAQIENGAPYDMFFSADVAYPKKLEAAGLVEPGTLYEYATGKLVIWVPAKSKLDIAQGLKVLLDPVSARSRLPIRSTRRMVPRQPPLCGTKGSTTASRASW